MDINQNLTHVNTFVGGMDSDTSDMYVKPETYREARNLRISTNMDSNTGELKLIEGVFPVENLNIIGLPSDYEQNLNEYEILASFSVRNIGSIIIKNNTGWFILRYEHKNSESPVVTKIFGPCTEPLGDKIEGTMRYESENNIHLYFVDGKHPLMCMSMYPSEDDLTQIDNLYLPNRSFLPPFRLSEKIQGGSLGEGIYLYMYHIYTPFEERSYISNFSTPWYLYNGEQKTASSLQMEFIDDTIIPDDIKNTTNAYIRIYRIKYEQVGQVPNVEMIADQVFSYDDNWNFIDFGLTPLEIYPLSEFNSYLFSKGLIAKTIDTKDNYLFIGNVEYNQDTYAEDFDASTKSYNVNGGASTDYPLFADNAFVLTNIPYSKRYKDEPNRFFIYTKDREDSKIILGGTGENVSWKFITKRSENPIDNDTNEPKLSYSKQTKIEKSLRRGEIYRYGLVLYSKDGRKSQVKHIQDIRVPDQTFQNIPSTVANWSSNQKGILTTFECEDNKMYSVLVGVEFDIKNLPSDCIGVEIVRCNRSTNDMISITQCATGYPLKHNKGGAFESTFWHNPLLTTWPVRYNSVVGNFHYNSDASIFELVSPEISYSGESISQIMEANTCYILCVLVYKSKERAAYGEWNVGNVLKHTSHYYWPLSLDNSFLVETEPHLDAELETKQPWIYINYLKLRSNDRYGNYERDQLSDNYTQPLSVYDMLYNALLKDIHQEGGTLIGSIDFKEVIENWDSNGERLKKFHYNDESAYIKYLYSQSINTKGKDTEGKDTEYKYYATIDKFATIKAPQPDEMFINDGKVFNASNTEISIGGYSYCPIFPSDLIGISNPATGIDDVARDMVSLFAGSSGNHMAITISQEEGEMGSGFLFYTVFSELNPSKIEDMGPTNPLVISNVYKPAIAYGGPGENAIKNSIFYSHGQFIKVENNQCSQQVYDGDTYIQCYEHVNLHKTKNDIYPWYPQITIIYSIPLETSILLPADKGVTYSKQKNNKVKNASWILEKPVRLQSTYIDYTQTEPMYQYNAIFSNDVITNSFYINDERYKDKLKYDTRIHVSNQKTNNELLDSWTRFKALNYLDVDSNYGQITNLRTFQNRLYYWQERAFGTVSVNERQLIQNVDNTNLVLGTGDVLDRYDYISKIYGMNADDISDAQSDYYLYWVDRDQKEMLRYNGQNGLSILSTEKKIKTIFNIADLSKPIRLLYDTKYKEVLNNQNLPVFNEQSDTYISIYDIDWKNNLVFDQTTVLLDNKKHLINILNSSKDNNVAINTDEHPLYPYLRYIINSQPTINKVFDILTFGGRFYKGEWNDNIDGPGLLNLWFEYNTPLKQKSKISAGSIHKQNITNREYDFRLCVPRSGKLTDLSWTTSPYGDRMKGKTMLGEFGSTSNSLDFSLQYITTKFRISWS